MGNSKPDYVQWMYLVLAGLALILLSSCGPISVGPFTYNPSNARSHYPVLYADPGVRITRADKTSVAYQPGMDIFAGDTIETNAGVAVLDMGDDDVVVLNRHTKIELGSIKLFFGEIFSRISQLTQRGGGQVVTTEVSASLEGTEYAVRRQVTKGGAYAGASQVLVRRGKVRCDPPAGSPWKPLTLTENLALRIDGPRIGKPLRVDAQAETKWADEAEKRLLPAELRASFGIGIGIPVGSSSESRQPSEPSPPASPRYPYSPR